MRSPRHNTSRFTDRGLPALSSAEMIVSRIVKTHRDHSKINGIHLQMVVWLNTGDLKTLFKCGVKLLVITLDVVADSEPDFRSTEFTARGDWPGRHLILVHPKEFKTERGRKFHSELENKLKMGEAKIVFADRRFVPLFNFSPPERI